MVPIKANNRNAPDKVPSGKPGQQRRHAIRGWGSMRRGGYRRPRDLHNMGRPLPTALAMLPRLPHLPADLALVSRPFQVDDTQLDALLDSGLALPPSLAHAVLKRKVEFLSGRDCARAALAQAGHAGPFELPIGDDRAPCWPTGWVGSISHSKGCAAAIVAQATAYRGIGLDLERLIPPERAAPLREQIGHAGEWQLGETLGLAPGLWFTLVFSLKEALFKALYPQVGRYFGFEDATLHAFAPGQGIARLRLNADLAPGLPAGTEVAAQAAWNAEHVLSLCLAPRDAHA
ncbi:4'-phosphopantetheinyl transferase [Chitiniphilus eburneus]